MNYRDVLGFVAMFCIVGMVALFLGVITWGVNNDYLLSEIYDFSETMNDSGQISVGIMESIEEVAESHSQLANYFDWFWLLFYVGFLGSTVAISYYAKQEDEFSFLAMLFYGTMILLFFFSVSLVITNWLADILFSVVPNLEGAMPKFNYWLDWAGLYTFIHLILCIFANKVDLGIGRSMGKKTDASRTEEIL